MQTLSSSKFVGESSTDPTSTNLKRRNRRRSKQRVELIALEKTPVVTMADQRTMAELLRPPTEGYAKAIVIPPIPAEHFEPKHNSLNSAAGGNLLERSTQDALKIIKNKSRVRNSRNKPIVCQVKASNVDSSEMAKLTDAVSQCPATNGNTFTVSHDDIQGYVSAAAVNNNYNQGYRPQGDLHFYASNQMGPPGFPCVQNNQNYFNQNQGYNQNQGNNQNQGSNLNQGNNQNQVFNQNQGRRNNFNQAPTYQAPTHQPQVVTQSDFQAYMKANDAVMKNMQTQMTSLTNLNIDLKSMFGQFMKMNTASSSGSGSGSLPRNTVPNPQEDLKVRSGATLTGPSVSPSPPPLSKEVGREPKTITDQVFTGSTNNVPPLVVQPSPASTSSTLISSPKIPELNPHQPLVSYPSRLNKEKLQGKDDIQIHSFLQMFKKIHFNISFFEALAHMPKKLPEKLEDPGRFLIPCEFHGLESCMTLVDLEASINLMPLSVWKTWSLPELSTTRMTLELATRTVAIPAGIAEDVSVQVGKFTFPADFVVVDYEVDPQVPLILGRPFLRTAHALVGVHGEKPYESVMRNWFLTLKVPQNILKSIVISQSIRLKFLILHARIISMRVSEEQRLIEEEEADELYRDVDINQGRGLQVSQNVEDSHVTLTPVQPDGQQESSSVSSFVTSMLNPISDAGVESIFTTASSPIAPIQTSTPIMTPFTISTITTSSEAPIPPTTIPSAVLQNLPTFDSVFRFEDIVKSLEVNFSEFMQTNQFAEAVSKIPDVEMMMIRKDPPLDQTGGRRDEEKVGSLNQLALHLNQQPEVQEALQQGLNLDRCRPPRKPPTSDRDWNKTLPAIQGSAQTWISELAKQADSRSYFNELLDTLIDFSNFIINRLSVDTLTPELLARPIYELMKGSCTSLTELEYHLEEVYKATTDQLDWVNHEGDFKRLRLQDIEDMLLLLIQGKLSNLTIEDRFAFNVSLRMFTRSIVIQRRVEDLQLGVESYQKRLNLTKPDTYRSDLKRRKAYAAYSNPRGFIYQNKDKKNRLMRIDKLYKFSDGMLNDVRNALDDRLKGIRMQYLPQKI
nr:hypothetical protein [Tanacetum cinerariifolium]